MDYRPKEVAERLGIAPVTLRVWSERFADLLSPRARRALRPGGTSAQRRYSDSDIVLLERAKRLLDKGATFDEARRRLLQDAEASAPEVAPSSEQSTALAELNAGAPYLLELRRLYEEALATRDELLNAKDETITEQRSHIEDLRSQLEQMRTRIAELEANPQVEAPSPRPWWRRIFGGEPSSPPPAEQQPGEPERS